MIPAVNDPSASYKPDTYETRNKLLLHSHQKDWPNGNLHDFKVGEKKVKIIQKIKGVAA